MIEAKLYGYFRSSAAYRVRIGLNLKGLQTESVFVHLRHGEQRSPGYLELNAAGLVPLWQEPTGFSLGQSLAILEYIDEKFPGSPLLPTDICQRARAREIALTIACDIHPVGNLRVLDKLSADFGASVDDRSAWNRHWIAQGFTAVEARLSQIGSKYAVCEHPTIADIVLVPQVYNARRFGLDLSPFPRICEIDRLASELPAFAAAAPERQPDAE